MLSVILKFRCVWLSVSPSARVYFLHDIQIQSFGVHISHIASISLQIWRSKLIYQKGNC